MMLNGDHDDQVDHENDDDAYNNAHESNDRDRFDHDDIDKNDANIEHL